MRFVCRAPATTEFYTLSLHDALPILVQRHEHAARPVLRPGRIRSGRDQDRKSTRLNSSHGYTSYAVFCLKKKMAPSYAFVISETEDPARSNGLWKTTLLASISRPTVS